MKVKKAADFCLQYHTLNSSSGTLRCYKFVLKRFSARFSERDIDSFTQDEILFFLNSITEGTKQSTKKERYVILKAFLNFIRNSGECKFENPCNAPIVKKMFNKAKYGEWTIFSKDTIDEIIYRTDSPRNRLMLELMARAGMRIGEVIKITPNDAEDRKILLRDPKSGKPQEIVYITQKIASRLQEYINKNSIPPDQRIFPISYVTAWAVVKKAGRILNINLRPHDLRRHAATYASRSGTPLEIVSKVILRHSNLAITQRYLGKVDENEAMRWIENLHG